VAKKKGEKKETKSDFFRKAPSRNPDLELRQVNRQWAKKGIPGEISGALYYQIRAKLGIKTVWQWVKVSESEHPDEAYQFKITLPNTDPPIWRRIQVPDGSLDKLHEHVQTAMGWTNSHLHHFRIGERLHGDPMLMQENFEEMNYADSTTAKLSDLFPRGSKPFRFEYEYDFGDSWLHEVLFEGLPRADPKKSYPLCVEGARACPPEDVGSPWGYARSLEALADPQHEAHDDMREWIGGKFDSEKFRAAVATRRMREGLPDWRSMP
jgi:hypothetical protein